MFSDATIPILGKILTKINSYGRELMQAIVRRHIRMWYAGNDNDNKRRKDRRISANRGITTEE